MNIERRKNGSEFSYRKIQNKKKSVYEANITIIDALKKSNEDIKNDLNAQFTKNI